LFRSGSELLFFFLILVILFSGDSLFRGFGVAQA